jgi:hypothetical protein
VSSVFVNAAGVTELPLWQAPSAPRYCVPLQVEKSAITSDATAIDGVDVPLLTVCFRIPLLNDPSENSLLNALSVWVVTKRKPERSTGVVHVGFELAP